MQKVVSLIKDHELPEIIRQVVGNAPKNRKVAAFIACLAALCAMCPRVRLKYFFDSRLSALLLQVLIEGAQSSGKSFAADIEGLIMNDTLKARDKAMRRLEQEYRDKKKRRKANEKLEEEQETTIRVVPPTISKTVLTKRADMYERVFGDTLTFWMFAEELAQVTDAGKNGYSNLRTIMRTAYDLGSEFGIDFASDNSYSAIVDINRMYLGPVSMVLGCSNFARLWGPKEFIILTVREYAKRRGFDPDESVSIALKARRRFWTHFKKRHKVKFPLEL